MFVPRRNRSGDVLAEKFARIREPHVKPLNDFADELALAAGLRKGEVPYVDPELGGIYAQTLVLFDCPSTKAEFGTGSGLLSPENDDHTAANCARAYVQFGIEKEDVVHWNAAPLPPMNKNGSSTARELRTGAQTLPIFMSLLRGPRFVLLMGANARKAWEMANIEFPSENVLISPHSSMRGLNQNNGRERFLNTIEELATRLRR